jgi:hypothetical protein
MNLHCTIGNQLATLAAAGGSWQHSIERTRACVAATDTAGIMVPRYHGVTTKLALGLAGKQNVLISLSSGVVGTAVFVWTGTMDVSLSAEIVSSAKRHKRL